MDPTRPCVSVVPVRALPRRRLLSRRRGERGFGRIKRGNNTIGVEGLCAWVTPSRWGMMNHTTGMWGNIAGKSTPDPTARPTTAPFPAPTSSPRPMAAPTPRPTPAPSAEPTNPTTHPVPAPTTTTGHPVPAPTALPTALDAATLPTDDAVQLSHGGDDDAAASGQFGSSGDRSGDDPADASSGDDPSPNDDIAAGLVDDASGGGSSGAGNSMVDDADHGIAADGSHQDVVLPSLNDLAYYDGEAVVRLWHANDRRRRRAARA